ncbi:unnamed protein product [Closterium sp. NIES-64]|nr:unnamed protein product [Closterium sp. NIES-64]
MPCDLSHNYLTGPLVNLSGIQADLSNNYMSGAVRLLPRSTLTPFTVLPKGTQQETVGRFGEKPLTLFMYPPGAPLPKAVQIKEQEATFAPSHASPFSRYVSADFKLSATRADSWSIRDFHTWDNVPFFNWPVKNQNDCILLRCVQAYAVAFETLTALDASSGLTGASDPASKYPVQAFEQAQFKGYVGLMLAVQRQPVVVHIEASPTFMLYDGTFKYQDPGCYTGNLNHVVLVIGYFITRNDGSQNRIAPPFWIIRNSWGEEWGKRGHMRMDIQGGDGVCGINVLPGIYPILKSDPCGQRSYKGDGDSQPSMNPYGRFQCQATTETTNICTCNIPTAPVQPFVEAENGYGSNTCAYGELCGKRRANTTATTMTVSGDNWWCSDVHPLVGLSLAAFTDQNTGIDCSQPLPKGSVLQLDGTPATPCTAFVYSLNGDTCASISRPLNFTEPDLTALNPGLDCSKPIKAGCFVCIKRSATFAFTVPECVRYGMFTPQDTCERLL